MLKEPVDESSDVDAEPSTEVFFAERAAACNVGVQFEQQFAKACNVSGRIIERPVVEIINGRGVAVVGPRATDSAVILNANEEGATVTVGKTRHRTYQIPVVDIWT